MSRTAIAVITASPNSSASDTHTDIDQGNGMYVPASAPGEQTILRVVNSHNDADQIVTVNEGDSPPALSSGQSHLHVTVAQNGGVKFIGPFTSARFIQSDGTIEVDFDAGFVGEIVAIRIPRTA